MEVTVSATECELLDNQVSPVAHHLTGEHNIPIPVFQDDGSGPANENDGNDEHSGAFTHLDWPCKSPRFESSWKSVGLSGTTSEMPGKD